MGLLRIRALLFIIFLWPGPAGAALASSLRVSDDPRIELLGVLQRLAFASEHGLKSFEAFKNHPVVDRYRSTIKENQGRDPYGLILLALTDPPALAWKRKPLSLSGEFITAAGGRGQLEEFLASLREFASSARFMEFYDSQKEPRRALLNKVRRDLGTIDHMKALEAYLGHDLETRMNVIVSSVYQPRYYTSYIFPYPYAGPGVFIKGPYEVFTLAGPENLSQGIKPDILWNEPLYIIVEKGFARNEERLSAHQGLHAKAGKNCPGSNWPACAKHIMIKAINGRLSEKVAGIEPVWPAPPLGAMEKRLSESLREYEGDRKRYPTILDFYPRLISAFGALEGEFNTAPEGRAPAGPR